MRISTMINYASDFRSSVAEVQALERAGLDLVWVPEAYSFDAPSAMGYLAAMTDRVTIASGILPVYTRTPTLLAMTAAGIDSLSDGRAMLGLGASGPQVMEGFHGVKYEAPVGHLRETIEICRKVWRREKVEYQGDHYQVPLPADRGTGLGKPLKIINHPVRDEIPICVASLGPASVKMTAELADAWLPVFFSPEAAEGIWGKSLAEGARKRDPNRAPLDIFSGGAVAIGENLEHLRDRARPTAALYIGGMGARSKNFYNDIFAQSGYEAEAKQIQDLYLDGKKKEAEAAIPAEYLAKHSLIGPEGYVRDSLHALKEAGVTSLNIQLSGDTVEERVQQCEKLRDLVDTL